MQDLSPEAAAGLATWDEELNLGGLTALSAEAAEALVPHTGRLWLGGIAVLDAEDSVAVATALARKRGRVALPALKSLSPKTLSALLGKDDIGLPDIESIEFISEPDGTPTEDFVMPEGFLDRQRRGGR
jgi:hypothetical protein